MQTLIHPDSRAATYLSHTAPVLIVAADDLLRQTLQAMLEDEGYSVMVAAHPKTALQLLRESPARLVVLYAVEPQVGGARSLGDDLRERDLAQRHAFVLLTGASAAPLIAALSQVLASLRGWVIAMPFDLETLLSRVAVATYTLWAEEHLTPELLAVG